MRCEKKRKKKKTTRVAKAKIHRTPYRFGEKTEGKDAAAGKGARGDGAGRAAPKAGTFCLCRRKTEGIILSKAATGSILESLQTAKLNTECMGLCWFTQQPAGS